jgi:hypothetical protein
MNILIEDAETLKYLTNEKKWTKNPADGKNFAATASALTAAKEETMGEFNIVGYFTTSRQLINMDHGHGKRAAA